MKSNTHERTLLNLFLSCVIPPISVDLLGRLFYVEKYSGRA